jgi:hypothetical protein
MQAGTYSPIIAVMSITTGFVTVHRGPEIFVIRLAQRIGSYVSQPDRGKIRCPVSSYGAN